jgi:hypothetical protein
MHTPAPGDPRENLSRGKSPDDAFVDLRGMDWIDSALTSVGNPMLMEVDEHPKGLSDLFQDSLCRKEVGRTKTFGKSKIDRF